MAELLMRGSPYRFTGFDEAGQAVFEELGVAAGTPNTITMSPILWAEAKINSVAAGEGEPAGIEFTMSSITPAEATIDWENY